MITLTVRTHFEAAHHFALGEADDPRRRMHGHSYEVEASFIAGEQRQDLEGLKNALTLALEPVDHAILNEVEGLNSPAMEDVAVFIADRLISAGHRVHSVRLNRPTLGFSAQYTVEGDQ